MKRLFFAAVFSFACLPSFAATESYTIDPSHTYPSFETPHMGISFWRGKFDATTGKVMLDRAAKNGSVEVSINAESIDFGHEKMNEHARGTDFFDVQKYPTITYRGKLVYTGDTPTAVEGALTLHGVTKPVNLAISSFKCIEHPMLKKQVCGADASAEIDRADFGMDYGAKFGPTNAKLAIQVEAVRD